jgi:exodeoxyribonuclease X
MTVRVIDCETTGADPAVDEVIEIASVDLCKEGGITNQQEYLICPTIPVPPEASAVHHLTYRDLTGKPPLKEVLAFFRGADAYVAHNCDFEKSFLGEHLGDAQWVCTWKCALRVWPDYPFHKNQVVRYRLGLVDPFGIDGHTPEPAPRLERRDRDGRGLRRAHQAHEVVRPGAVVSGAGALHAAAYGQVLRRAVRRRTGGLPSLDRGG